MGESSEQPATMGASSEQPATMGESSAQPPAVDASSAEPPAKTEAAPAAPSEPPLPIRTRLSRDPIRLLGLLGIAVVCVGVDAGVWWLRPPVFVRWGLSHNGRGPGYKDFNSIGIIVYVCGAIAAFLALASVAAFFVSLVSGMVKATCPACSADILVGGNTDLDCPKCQRRLHVVGTEAPAPASSA